MYAFPARRFSSGRSKPRVNSAAKRADQRALELVEHVDLDQRVPL